MDMLRKAWQALRAGAVRFGKWIWPFVLAVLLVMAVRRGHRAEKREQKYQDRLEAKYVSDLKEHADHVDKDIERANRAQAKAQQAKDTARKHRDALAKAAPGIDELLDEYRAVGVQRGPDAT